MIKTVRKTSDFIFKDFKLLFDNVYSSYIDKPYKSEIISKGGRASGKSYGAINTMIFMLPEIKYHESMIVCFSNTQKQNSATLVEQLLIDNGYRQSSYTRKQIPTGDIKFYFGNSNILTIMSVATKSEATALDRMKNLEFENAKSLKNPLKFLFFEEFTGTLSTFKTVDKTINALSSFNRHKDDKCITFYNYNPPQHKMHLVFKWLKMKQDALIIHSTIFDLPENVRSKSDIELANNLKETNPKLYEHIYLGSSVGEDGLAFVIDKSIFTELANNYVSFHLQTDEATVNATTFGLFGITSNGELHYITNFYHSSKIDGKRYSQDYYARKCREFVDSLGVNLQSVVTDGIAFAYALRDYGFSNATSIGSLKDRPLGYKILETLILENKFKIVDSPENAIMYTQLENAEVEYITAPNSPNYGKAVISKKAEGSSNDNETHTHAVDTAMYLCLFKQKFFSATTKGGRAWN